MGKEPLSGSIQSEWRQIHFVTTQHKIQQENGVTGIQNQRKGRFLAYETWFMPSPRLPAPCSKPPTPTTSPSLEQNSQEKTFDSKNFLTEYNVITDKTKLFLVDKNLFLN
jgi:hypothetical protein